MKSPSNWAPAPVVILAIGIIDDVSEWCVRMAVLNRHEAEPQTVPDTPVKGVKRGR